jgi:hypothetical protein
MKKVLSVTTAKAFKIIRHTIRIITISNNRLFKNNSRLQNFNK